MHCGVIRVNVECVALRVRASSDIHSSDVKKDLRRHVRALAQGEALIIHETNMYIT